MPTDDEAVRALLQHEAVGVEVLHHAEGCRGHVAVQGCGLHQMALGGEGRGAAGAHARGQVEQTGAGLGTHAVHVLQPRQRRASHEGRARSRTHLEVPHALTRMIAANMDLKYNCCQYVQRNRWMGLMYDLASLSRCEVYLAWVDGGPDLTAVLMQVGG